MKSKQTDNGLSLFEVDLNGDLVPNALLFGEKGEQNESELELFRGESQSNSLSQNTGFLAEQESGNLHNQNNRKMDKQLSKHDKNSISTRTNNISTTTSADGTRNFTKRGIATQENRDGDGGFRHIEGSGSELGLLYQRQSEDKLSRISSSNPNGFDTRRRKVGRERLLENANHQPNNTQDTRQGNLFSSGQDFSDSNGGGTRRGDSTNTEFDRQRDSTNANRITTSQSTGIEDNDRIGIADNAGELGKGMGELLPSGENQRQIAKQTDFSATDEVFIGGQKDRYNKNIKAIQTLKLLEQENRLPHKEEQIILNNYSGWGGIPQVFDLKNEKWRKEAGELIGILDNEEYEAARLSTLDSFYTPKIVVDSIYKGLNQLGFNNDSNSKDIFEPSAGVGTFLSYVKNHSNNYNFTCTEIDSISQRILSKLYPNQKTHNIGFQHYLFDRQFDAFIGNPPFGQKKIIDLNDSYLSNLSVHNYFIANSIKHLKENGIAAFVVSSYFMDSIHSDTREYIAKNATFLGAIRLPNNLFKARANTEVTTDIVFFQKGKNEELNKKWIESKRYFDDYFKESEQSGIDYRMIESFKINEYFKNNPKNILGEMKIVSSQYGHDLECINDSNINIEQEINRFISELPKDIYTYQKTKILTSFYTLDDKAPDYYTYKAKLENLKDGNYFIHNDEIFMRIRVFQKQFDNPEIVFKKPEFNEHDKRRIKKLIQIRDEFNKLIQLEKSTESMDSEIESQRLRLNSLYDDFVKKEGYINRDANKKAFCEDVEANKVLALEKNYNKGISKSLAQKQGVLPQEPKADKADIFFRRTITPKQQFSIKTPKEALLASISEYGKLELSFLEKNLPMPLEESLQNLLDEKLIFKDHKNDTNYIIAQKYLSGNVKAKFKEVQNLITEHNRQDLISNFESLKAVLPKDLKASEISATIGTSWIPLKYYCDFIEEKLNISKENYEINYSQKSGEWSFYAHNFVVSDRIKAEYSTSRKNITAIVSHALQRRPIVVNDTIISYDDSGKEIKKEVLNPKETAIAIAKVAKIKAEFEDWIYKDYDRRIDLEKIYNETFNTNVEPQYDGSHLKLENFNSNITLKAHQKNAIFRAIQESSIILDHQVGAGKTLTSICAIMEQKRMGIVNKPLIVVPNHILNQWHNEFYNAYPNANILLATKKDLEKNSREQFFAKIATNDYDAIIMTHSQFTLLGNPYQQTKKLQEEEIEILRETLENRENSQLVNYSVKNLEMRLENAKIDLEKLLNEHKKSKNIDFSELGIDMLVIDEAHEFKNLRYVTTMDRVSGLGNQKGSQKAFNLYCKTQFLHENNAKIMFLTGTPISNSIVELYTIQKYIQPQTLKEKRIHSFDAWASTFGEVSSAWELDSSGINYKIVSRFNKFKNVPELSAMYRNAADTITNADIMKFQKDFVPKLYNNKPINIVTPRSDEVAEFIGIQDENGIWNEGSIVWRMEHQSDDIARNNLLACTTDARKAGLDFRLINPYADDYEESKINILAKNIYEEWKNWQEDKGTQLVFCDLSTPKIHSQNIDINIQFADSSSNEEFVNINDEIESMEREDKNLSAANLDEILAKQSKFDVYSDVLKKLTNLGIPQNEIRFIHDAKTDLQKAELFADVNAGKVRILIGSTAKMGAGTNVQERVIAIHHLDCPWRPSDLEQRNGRVIRQGNKLFLRDPANFRIKEFRYATERTYDARMWQVIESKASSIEQFRKAGLNVRELEDISSGAADAAEMKAEATGNPLILMQVQLSSDLKQEEILYSNFKKEQYHNEESLNKSKSLIIAYNKEKETLNEMKNIINSHTSEHFSGKFYHYNADCSNYDKIDFIVRKNDDSEANKDNQTKIKRALAANIKISSENFGTEFKLFDYKGLTISLEKTRIDSLNFYITTPNGNFIEPENLIYKKKDNSFMDFGEIVSLGGLITRINNFYNGIDERIHKIENQLHNLAAEVSELEKITGKNTKQYPRYDYLLALREDETTIMTEIEKMSKEKLYKSNFIPKSKTILETMKHKSINDDLEI